MNSNVVVLKEIFDLNNKLFLKAFEAMEKEESHKQFSEANPAIWLMCHAVWAKAGIARLLGAEVNVPQWVEPFSKGITELDATNFPELDQVEEAWQNLHGQIEATLPNVSDEHLTAEQPQRFPTTENSILAALAFLGQHESYHVGQLSYVRRLLDEQGLFKLAFSPN